MTKKVIVKPKLNKILKEKGWTQTKLAQVTGIPQGTISRFDRTGLKNEQTLFTIAYALGVKVEDLYEIEIIEENDQQKSDSD